MGGRSFSGSLPNKWLEPRGVKGENSRCPPLSGATLPLHCPKSDGLLTLCPGALLTSRRLGPVFNLPEVQAAS